MHGAVHGRVQISSKMWKQNDCINWEVHRAVRGGVHGGAQSLATKHIPCTGGCMGGCKILVKSHPMHRGFAGGAQRGCAGVYGVRDS